MIKESFSFSSKNTACYFEADFNYVEQLSDPARTVLITDENVFKHHQEKFAGKKIIVLQAGEENKIQATADYIIQKLISFNADRSFSIVGIGGGVITDLTGYAASVYMRGLNFGFVPVSLLAMVDASIGGKNGIDVGPYKNLVGTIRQPSFLLYDSSFLASLPHEEWINGFAEIIKHACIKDEELFIELSRNNIHYYKNNKDALNKLVQRNVQIKCNVVMHDEFEQGDRRLLNFGHTWGHAIETKLKIPHGHAVSIGMVMAAKLSQQLTGFKETEKLINLLQQYELPVSAEVNTEGVLEVLKMDKKKDNKAMNYVVLNRIGEALIKRIPIDELENLIVQCK